MSHTSVKRNRFRRKLYDLAHNHTLGTADILCIPRKGVILSEDASAFLDEIKILLKKSQTFVFHPSDRPLPVRKILPKKTSPLSPL